MVKPTSTTRGSAASAPIEGEVIHSEEIVEAVGQAIVRASGDLDASLAVALSEAEIDKQIQTAHRFPRSVDRALKNIRELSTLDPETAMECNYRLPRGKEGGRQKFIEGPSIRFAELVAQQWGNNRVAARTVAVDRKEKYVEAEGIYHDLETNTAVCARVRRRISDSRGGLYNDDMIMVTSNAAASIALRNAILRGIPKPIWRMAYQKVGEVIRGDLQSLGARRVELLKKFKDDLGIKPRVVYQILGVEGEQDIGLDEFANAAGFYTALRNGEVTVDDLLDTGAPTTVKTLDRAFAEQKPAPKAEPEPEADKTPARTLKPPDPTPAPKEDPKPEPEAEKDPPAAEDEDGGPAAEDLQIRENPEDRRDPAQDEVDEEEVEPTGNDVMGNDLGRAPAEGAFEQFEADVGEAECWEDLKAALGVLAGSDDYRSAAPDVTLEARQFAFTAYQKLFAAKKETVEPTTDPFLFGLWLETAAEPDEARQQFRKLIRSPAYVALSDDGKDAVAEAVTRAEKQGA